MPPCPAPDTAGPHAHDASYYYTPRAERPVLTLYHHMPTAIHEATALFVQRALLSRSGPLRRILSAHEIKGIAAGTAASPLPGGPADKGFRDPTASAAKHRHKPRALQKRADIALEHHPSNVALSADRSDDGDHSSESEQEEAQTAPHAEPQVLPFPHAIIEVGYSQKYPSLVADAEDWLVSSQGAIRTVFIVCVEYATIPQSSITPHAPPPDDTASNNDPDDDDDAPASSPPRAADSPPASSPEPTPTVYSRAAHDIATDPALVDAYIAPLNAFLEVWEYVPTAPGSTALRCPRVEIFANNVPARHVKVPMSRADFDLPEAQGKPSGQRNISWSKLTEYLIKARKADAYSRMTTLAKKRKADKRRAVGDVGGEYHADEDEEAGEDKRDRGARDMPVMGERETRGTEAKRRKM
ncbi:hypothetical protein DFH27DRAFT_338455 [Peziza echinospora]|nr:hypothetical protein DFH27DRAFT_338455 [Peziza echinospora]